MDLRYITGRNRNLLETIQQKGYNLESLFNSSNELIKILDILQLDRKDLQSFIERLKDAYDETHGKDIEPEPPKKRRRDRISVQSKTTQKVYWFCSTPDPDSFQCEDCGIILKFSDKELISHIKTNHSV